LKDCDFYLSQLRNKSILSSKEEIWGSLSLSVFSELLTNIYCSEIFKMLFMISTHLSARKEQEGVDSSDMTKSVDLLNKIIIEDHPITSFIKERIEPVISK
jgi:hypothetical protein